MISKIKNFVRLVKSIPDTIRALWWTIRNQEQLHNTMEEAHTCSNCNVANVDSIEDIEYCDEHKEMVEELGGPF